METEKIKSPKTNRSINIYGDAYKKLIHEGYTNDYLLSLPRVTISSPKRLTSKSKQNKGIFTNLKDTDQLILNQVDNLYLTCQTNKYLYQLCMSNPELKNKFKLHQQIDKKVNKIINKITSTRKLYAFIKWIFDKNINYKKTGDIFKDGQIYVYYQFNYNGNKNYIITEYYQELNKGKSLTKQELYNILFKIYANNNYIEIDYKV